MKVKILVCRNLCEKFMTEEIEEAIRGLDVISINSTYIGTMGIAYTILYKEKKEMENSKKLEMLSGIIETFENFLEYKGIDIENPEREENGSLIYGEDYYSLEEGIENILRCYGLLNEETP